MKLETLPELSSFEVEAIDLFVSVAGLLSLPRSVGEIYGLLFVAPEPLPMEAITVKLQISAGSASQGLRLLRSVGAVKPQYVAGERREHFIAETELRTVLAGYLREKVYPHLQSGAERLARMRQSARGLSDETREVAESRIEKLQRWNEIARKMLPLLHGADETNG